MALTKTQIAFTKLLTIVESQQQYSEINFQDQINILREVMANLLYVWINDGYGGQSFDEIPFEIYFELQEELIYNDSYLLEKIYHLKKKYDRWVDSVRCWIDSNNL